MPEREMNPQSTNNRRFRIEADIDTDEKEIEILLPDQLPRGRQPDKYKIVKKDIPSAARQKTFRGKSVIWINNYGIRLVGDFGVKQGGSKKDPFIDDVQDEQFEYEVIVPGPAPDGYPTLVYFHNDNVQPANATVDSAGNYHYKLNIGDPAAGWGGG